MNQKEAALVQRLNSELNLVMLCRFGSHLYGTDTPESDMDYKGIYMPTMEEMLLQKVPKSRSFHTKTSRGEGEKNSVEDVDCEVYSLHYFTELALKGETAALDMLHCNKDNLLVDSDCWQDYVAHREYFYTKNLKAFVGYARKQAAKYGLKGSRLNTAEQVLYCLNNRNVDHRLESFWDELPVTEHSGFLPHLDTDKFKVYQFCGKQVQSTVKVQYLRDMVRSFLDTYGERARLAQQNEGVDWKAMSHALRAAYQVEEILSTDDLKYPLKCAEYLKAVKQGKVPFKTVLQSLEDLMEAVETLSEMSRWPEKADHNFWKYMLLEWLEDANG